MVEKRVGHNVTADVDHRIPLAKGGSNASSNLRIRSIHANRSFKRDSKGHMR